MLSQILDWVAAHPGITGAVVIASLGLAVIYAALIFFAIGRMSPDYFVRDGVSMGAWRHRHPALRWIGFLIKNFLWSDSGIDRACHASSARTRSAHASHRHQPARFSWQAKPRKENRPYPYRPSGDGRDPPPGRPVAVGIA